MPQVRKFILGPGEPGKIQAKFFGSDPNVLRDLASQAEAVIRTHSASAMTGAAASRSSGRSSTSSKRINLRSRARP